MIPLELEHAVWEQVYMVAPLTIVGTREPDGTYDLAPKHLAIPMSWQDHYGFVCTPSHATYANATREGCFTVSFPRPDQICSRAWRPPPAATTTTSTRFRPFLRFRRRRSTGVLLEHAYLHFECELDRVIDDLGDNSLIIGRIVAAAVAEDCLARRGPRRTGDDRPFTDAGVFAPGRFAEIVQTNAFPYHVGFKR